MIKNILVASTLLLLFNTKTAFGCNKTFFDECLNGVGPAVTNNDYLRTSSNKLVQSLRQHDNEQANLDLASVKQVGRSAGEFRKNSKLWCAGGHRASAR